MRLLKRLCTVLGAATLVGALTLLIMAVVGAFPSPYRGTTQTVTWSPVPALEQSVTFGQPQQASPPLPAERVPVAMQQPVPIPPQPDMAVSSLFFLPRVTLGLIVMALFLLAAVKAIKCLARSSACRRRDTSSEAELVQDIHDGLLRMERRIEALETLLVDSRVGGPARTP